MKKIWKVVGLIGMVAIAFGATGLAFAQTESPQPYTNPGYDQGMMGGRGSYGGGMAYGEVGLYHEIMVGSFAEVIGISVDQLEARLEAGETMWQIVEAEGTTWDEFIAMMQEVHSATLEQAVEDGTMSQERAEFMNSRGQVSGDNQEQGNGSCMEYENSDQQGFQRGSQGRWNAP
jgi:hypothetical protein